MKIEKNIPIPEMTSGNDKGYRRTLRIMEVKDSVWVEKQIGDRMRIVISFMHRTTEMKFTTRKEKDGLRIWRIK